MSAFSDRDVLESVREKSLFTISPLVLENIQCAGIDLTLHRRICVLTGTEPVRPDAPEEELRKRMQEIEIAETGYELQPGGLVSGYSEETLSVSCFVTGFLVNRASLAALGIDATLDASVSPGYHGRKSLVLHNCGPAPVLLTTGMPVCQLVLFKLTSPSLRTCKNRHDTGVLKQFLEDDPYLFEEPSRRTRPDSSLSELFNRRLAELSGRR